MNTDFIRHKKGSLVYYTAASFDKTKLVHHAFTTRLGGVSTGETASLNLSFTRKDPYDVVYKNFDIICSAIGIKTENLVLTNQIHENKVHILTKKDCGKRIVRESDIIGVDGFVCAEKGVPFAVFCADCVPILFLDPVSKIVGAAHSGWRSTVKNIAGVVIDKMVMLGSKPENILCAIGASIGKCCFEVDEDVALLFDERLREKIGDKYHVDLWETVRGQLIKKGIRDENISLAGICSCCHNDEFFSSRAQKGNMGHMGAFIEMAL